MKCDVVMLPEAKGDLVDIYSYVFDYDTPSKADRLLESLEVTCNRLETHSQRGHEVPELKRIHVTGFREIHYKPYRIIFQQLGPTVYVHAILDGRRELQTLLEQRLLG